MSSSKSIAEKIKLLCTLGPASLNEKTIVRLDEIGVDIFRINLSHTEIERLTTVIKEIKRYTKKPICIDTEGAQVRTGYVENNSIYLEENSIVEIVDEKIIGNSLKLSFTPSFVIKDIKPCDLISVDFDSVLLHVIGKNGNSVMAKVVSAGFVGSNKAVTIPRDIKLPAITDKDKKAVRIALKHGISYFALSFANSRQAVEEFRKICGKEKFIISKIESKKGLANVDEICQVSDALLIDRGDLSREEPIDKIPFIQKLIIKKAKSHKVPVYVATNLLESMIKSKKPSRAEANDVINTLLDGAHGLVLAAETAIGSHPINCAVMISRMIKHFQDIAGGFSLEELQRKDSFLLIEPHGGSLVNRLREDDNSAIPRRYKTIFVGINDLLNAEQIAIGTFSPLEGFMNKIQLESVLNSYRLVDGTIWPLPITLQLTKQQVHRLNTGDTVALAYQNTGDIYAFLHIEDIFFYNLDKMSKEIFGIDDISHPGVQVLKKGGNYFIGGKIEVIKRLPSEYKHYELTPQQVRTIFENKGWSRVAAFHTRNVIHRAHEHIQMLALHQYHCDGLFIHPVSGPKKKGDYQPGIILKSYDLMIDKYYPKGKVVMAAFQNYSRYCGPREAVFTALCRKNFGCSHFIVGRDHTGIGKYYSYNAAHKLFEKLGDIGIVPIFFNAVHYCKRCNGYVDKCKHSNSSIAIISGTECREILNDKKCPPEWFMRRKISELIIDEMRQGKEVFVS